MSDLIERLRDEEYRGPLQHLRSYSDLDKLHDEAADAIAAKDREIAELRQRTIEECAKVADEIVQRQDQYASEGFGSQPVRSTAFNLAAAIRSLGKEGSGE